MNPKQKKKLAFLASPLILIPVCFFGYIIFDVTRDASMRIQRGAINRIIASESPVFYSDGKTPIGVFFEKTHRRFMHYEEIPKIFIKALIAAEDSNFFSHSGVDFKAILRAFLVNVKSGKIVQGGSTITQQTAKNIFKREKRSYKTKLRELIQAFLLEKEYAKEELLEIYINQFFVTGYGKGLGIAAQCFFDKDAKELNLVEAAFIAGSVKGPNKYNPFIKKTDAEKNKARDLSKFRKNYVLKNMLKMNFITQDEYLAAKKLDIPFKEGKITYRLNVILDYIREQLESDFFQTILKEQGVDNAVASGISIYTSIDRNIQEAALSSLRTRLPLLDVKLSGYDNGKLPNVYLDLYNKNQKTSESRLPFLTRITHIDPDNCRLVVAWQQGGSIINYEGILPIAEAWLKWKHGNASKMNKRHIRTFLKKFHKGDIVPVQVLPSGSGHGDTKLILSKIPELDGGIVVIQKGMIKAMVGGFLDRFFNRAVDAKRQLGSIFKPIVYTAALQLKWNSLEPLQNVRDVFQFQNTFYLPRPDHTPRSRTVSMEWAGAKSENLATVWLLYHLTDHLNMDEFRQIMKTVGLDRRNGESYAAYKKRIRDRNGVVVNTKAMKKAAFEKAKRDIESDLIFDGNPYLLDNLRRLHFSLDSEKLNMDDYDERQIQRYCFKRLSNLDRRMKERFQEIIAFLEQHTENRIYDPKELPSEALRHFYIVGDDERSPRVVYTEQPEYALNIPLRPITLDDISSRSEQLFSEQVWVDGLFDSKMLALLREKTKVKYMTFFSSNRYDSNVLFWIQDFRTLVNLSYVVYLSKQIGISTNLEPVLSFPLGPNSISISEAALVYQSIMTGQVYPIAPQAGLKMFPIITKIVDRDGEMLWEYEPEPIKILSNRVSGLVTGILRKVMETGTGIKAKNAIRILGIPIPSFGKTGTSNRFTNSSFVGFIPGYNKESGQLEILKGYVIASYVGYDDNRPMKSEHISIYGASGALPLWIDTAAAIVSCDKYAENIQPADLAFDPVSDLLSGFGNFLPVPVSPLSGLPLTHNDEMPSFQLIDIFADAIITGNILELKRHFEPTPGEIE